MSIRVYFVSPSAEQCFIKVFMMHRETLLPWILSTRIRVCAFAYFAHVLVRLFLSGTVVVVHRKNKPIRKHLLCIFFERFYWGPTYRMNSFCHRHRQSDFISKWLSFLLHVQRSTPFNIVNWKKKSQGTPNRSNSVNYSESSKQANHSSRTQPLLFQSKE